MEKAARTDAATLRMRRMGWRGTPHSSKSRPHRWNRSTPNSTPGSMTQRSPFQTTRRCSPEKPPDSPTHGHGPMTTTSPRTTTRHQHLTAVVARTCSDRRRPNHPAQHHAATMTRLQHLGPLSCTVVSELAYRLHVRCVRAMPSAALVELERSDRAIESRESSWSACHAVFSYQYTARWHACRLSPGRDAPAKAHAIISLFAQLCLWEPRSEKTQRHSAWITAPTSLQWSRTRSECPNMRRSR
jgi:hypothetical protein